MAKEMDKVLKEIRLLLKSKTFFERGQSVMSQPSQLKKLLLFAIVIDLQSIYDSKKGLEMWAKGTHTHKIRIISTISSSYTRIYIYKHLQMCVSREMLPPFLKGENAKNTVFTTVRSRNTRFEHIFSIRNDISCLLCIINISMTNFASNIPPSSFHILRELEQI